MILRQLKISILLITLFSTTSSFGQLNEYASLIGENEEKYEKLITDCSDMLLSVTDNSMDNAYALWVDMFAALENHADAKDIDIKGAKIWVNLFWEADGRIKHIAYYPKPNSKNMDFDVLSEVMNSFASTYTLPISYENCFSHYGSASFPVFTKVAVNNEK